MFLFGSIDELTKTEPLIDLDPLERLCKELSDTFHWNVTVDRDASLSITFVRRNGATVQAFTDSSWERDSGKVLLNVENSVRAYL